MRDRLGVSRGLLVLALAFNADDAGAVPLIDTSGNSVVSTLYPFGEAPTATVGQTFTVTGAETQLDRFAFRFDDYALSAATVDFAAYVYAWDGQKASGPQLYASAQHSSSNNGGAGGWESFVFDTGGINLAGGAQYVAFLSTSLFFDGIPSASTLELSNGYAAATLSTTGMAARLGS